MSDNEDLLGDDLGDHSLADYNLGNEEEEQLLADEYESGPQNVPSSLDSSSYCESSETHASYPGRDYEYTQPHQSPLEPECVVPNIIVEVPNVPAPLPTYAPYEPPPYDERAVPQPIAAAPLESPQIVPTEINPAATHEPSRERIVSERPPGAQRMPQVRHIPDSLDKVVLPRGAYPQRGRTSWRNPQFNARFSHPYKRNNVYRGNFNPRPSFPPPQHLMPSQNNPPQMRPEVSPERPQMGPPISEPQIIPGPVIPPERPMMRPERPNVPQVRPMIHPERPMMPDMPFRPNLPQERPPYPPNYQRFPFRPEMEEPRPPFGPNVRPSFDRPPFPYQRPPFPRPYGLQVTVRQPGMPPNAPRMEEVEPEVRMLPVSLPPNLPPAGLAGKKVLINPHFKGNFQPQDGPIKDIDDAAERFIAEQRNALARAANRKFPRRSPQRYIENTTIEIENDLVNRPKHDDDLLRRQEEFINANRAGLRRRMLRSPTPPPSKRSPSPRRRSLSPRKRSLSPRKRSLSPRRRPEPRDRPRADDEESEYKRRLREQESLRERVLRAKEVRRRKNAVALQRQNEDKERTERLENDRKANEVKETNKQKTDQEREIENKATTTSIEQDRYSKPDTTRKSPEKITRISDSKVRGRSPTKESAEVNSTCENLTPPRVKTPPKEKAPSPERALTPPLPSKRERTESDDELDLLLDDIEDILSDDDDTGRFKEKPAKVEPKPKPSVDLRSKLPPKPVAPTDTKKHERQKIVFTNVREERRKRDKTPPKRPAVSSTKQDDTETAAKKIKIKAEVSKFEVITAKQRQRIVFDNKQEPEKEKEQDKEKDVTQKPQAFSSRRVILQRKVTQPEKSVFSRMEIKSDPTKPNPGIFSRAVRTAIGAEKSRIVIKNKTEPEIEYESDSSSLDEDKLLEEDLGNIATVTNLPHGMTDTRLRTLAGSDVQSLLLEKEERRAKITFKTTIAAESFKRKFNNKMVAASRLTVVLQ